MALQVIIGQAEYSPFAPPPFIDFELGARLGEVSVMREVRSRNATIFSSFFLSPFCRAAIMAAAYRAFWLFSWATLLASWWTSLRRPGSSSLCSGVCCLASGSRIPFPFSPFRLLLCAPALQTSAILLPTFPRA